MILVRTIMVAVSYTHLALTPADVDTWVMINYTGRTMASGDVVVTRDPEIAKYQGTFNYYTHYTPDYVPFTPYTVSYTHLVYPRRSWLRESR